MDGGGRIGLRADTTTEPARNPLPPLNDWIDIGVLGTPEPESKVDRVLVIEKKQITGEKSRFELVVSERPTKAGIDPLNKLIDRNPEDNLKTVDRVP